ncbi:hypothetical protein J4H92_09215 [Leucobacter weissii]|uniref:Uncharacterized protein n=1 Tax=Leucobacter weissii TaxID=1983706 RepID=A0A939SC58_9MICO|nr:hypothetical protein [Leucobacter weissii]MBO1902125.1 hypothetical protein [Leucobacter weissii]
MTESPKPKKKVVRVESSSAKPSSARPEASEESAADGPVWTPAPEAKSRAGRLRVFAWAGWLLAIGIEAVLIFWVLRQDPVNMWLLIGGIVLTAALAIAGSLFWKQANRLDPASKKDAVRFFVQNQLGAIMSVIAFLPLIVLIFTNKNLDGKQKALAGGIGVVVALVAVFAFGADYSPPSQEQYAAEESIIVQLTGTDEVFWVKGGSVFHVCAAVPDVNKESQDGQIYQGSVAAAHEAGKDRLVSYWQREAVNYCGYTQEQVAAVEAAVSGEAPAEETPTENAPAEDATAE